MKPSNKHFKRIPGTEKATSQEVMVCTSDLQGREYSTGSLGTLLACFSIFERDIVINILHVY
jgi:hypothetical protein